MIPPIRSPAMDASDIAFAGVARQAELVRGQEISPRELVELHLDRIVRLDPQLNAFRIVYPERALAEADQAQARLRAGDERPLLGVPVAIKDNVDVAGDVTTHGTNAFGAPAREDSEVVRRVRAAGAIVVGRTNVPPLCAISCTESPTWGITRNPWDGNRPAGGPRGGAAAAVAAAPRKVPPGTPGLRVDGPVRAAVRETAELLGSLGHGVTERDPDYGLAGAASTARIVRGVGDEALTLPHYDRLDRRFRRWTRLS